MATTASRYSCGPQGLLDFEATCNVSVPRRDLQLYYLTLTHIMPL